MEYFTNWLHMDPASKLCAFIGSGCIIGAGISSVFKNRKVMIFLLKTGASLTVISPLVFSFNLMPTITPGAASSDLDLYMSQVRDIFVSYLEGCMCGASINLLIFTSVILVDLKSGSLGIPVKTKIWIAILLGLGFIGLEFLRYDIRVLLRS